MRKSIITTLVMAAVLMFNINAYAAEGASLLADHGSWKCVKVVAEDPMRDRVDTYVIASVSKTENAQLYFTLVKQTGGIYFRLITSGDVYFSYAEIIVRIDKDEPMTIGYGNPGNDPTKGTAHIQTEDNAIDNVEALLAFLNEGGKELLVRAELLNTNGTGTPLYMYQVFNLDGFKQVLTETINDIEK